MSDRRAGTTPVSLGRVREECDRIFASADSLYPSEIEFAEHVVALVELAKAAEEFVEARYLGARERLEAALRGFTFDV